MADEDNFDIDIYGDGEGMDEDSKAFYKQENEKSQALREEARKEQPLAEKTKEVHNEGVNKTEQSPDPAPTTVTTTEADEDVKKSPPQGVKRKSESDERRIDAGATNALMISELHWWTTEDDIRGWVNDADAEDELKDITFSEHKVNGKSKGQAFLEFTSPQASTAAKRTIEILAGASNSTRKFSVVFTNASTNPFKTLPKDAPARTKDDRPQRSTSASYSGSSYHNNNNNSYNSNSGNFRGGRGGFGRGNFNQGGYNNNNMGNRNFSGPMGGFNGGPGGFQGNMPMMNNFNGFNNRGGMMNNNMRGNMGGMRGGRGGMNTNMMPMNMMGMNPMAMNPLMAGINPQGFGGNAQPFNPAMFNQAGNQADWNPGAKRQRQD